jgi:hypothetical protein
MLLSRARRIELLAPVTASGASVRSVDRAEGPPADESRATWGGKAMTVLVCIPSATLHGVDSTSVSVEVYVSNGLPELWSGVERYG